jgi:hypothetical protein
MTKIRKLMILVTMGLMIAIVAIPPSLAQDFTFGGLSGAGPDFTYGGTAGAGPDYTYGGTEGAGPDYTYGGLSGV